MAAWSEYESLFVLPEGWTADASLTPRISVSGNSVSGSTDDDEASTESLPEPTPGFTAREEGLIRHYRSVERKHGEAIGKMERIEIYAKCYCLSDRNKTIKEQRPCVCYLHGNDAEYNALRAQRIMYKKEMDDFTEDHPYLQREYWNRILQRGGYDW
jgi:hypothetical protein